MTVMPAPEKPRSRGAIESPSRPKRSRRWRWWVAALVGLLLVVHLGGGWYFSGRIDSEALAATPGTMTPAFNDAQVVSVANSHVTLQRGVDAASNFEAPASYGLVWSGGSGHVGPAVVNADGTVTRALDLVTGVLPKPGQGAAIERAYYVGDPSTALGLPMRDVTIAGMPAWWVPAAAGNGSPPTAAAIFVHGQNGTRMDGLRFLESAHAAGLPVLLISYRNDAGAPADPSRRLQYGATEWRDLDAAEAWVQAQGTNRVVLAGQSMGGGIVASFLEHSSRRTAVTGLVLDCPMLSLSAMVANGTRSALPGGLAVPGSIVWVAERLTTLRYGVDWGAVDYLHDTSWLTVPALVTQGTDDPTVPLATVQELRDAKPGLVKLVEFPKALHAESWNTDMGKWNDEVVQFLGSVPR